MSAKTATKPETQTKTTTEAQTQTDGKEALPKGETCRGSQSPGKAEGRFHEIQARGYAARQGFGKAVEREGNPRRTERGRTARRTKSDSGKRNGTLRRTCPHRPFRIVGCPARNRTYPPAPASGNSSGSRRTHHQLPSCPFFREQVLRRDG